jgi:SAM-dependent methyltransferase
MTWQQIYLKRFYDPANGFVNGTVEFHRLCAAAVGRGSELLEIGAGPSNQTSRYLATLGRLHGLDVDPDVLNNDALSSAEVLIGDRFPYQDQAFDLCVSNYVCEHIADPMQHLREIHRVLRPGGAYVLRTPNRYHYVAAVSAFTPHWIHKLMANPLRALSRDAHDPYPTFYRMNSRHGLRRLANQCSFAVEELRMVEKEPSYGMASRLLFLPFLAYERVVNSTELLADGRSNVFAVLRKQ